MSKKKPVKYERLEQWVEDHDARIVQAGSYPAQVVFVKEDDLKSLCKAMDLPRMGKLSGGPLLPAGWRGLLCRHHGL